MIIPMQKYEGPARSYASWEGGFSDEELSRIVGQLDLLDFRQGRVGSGPGGGIVDGKVRDSDVVFLDPSPEAEWIYERMHGIINRINYDVFRFDITGSQPIQYTVYRGETSGHYDWHVDAGDNDTAHRKLSMVLQLSDPDEYEGGTLELMTGPEPTIVPKRRGHAVAFPSFLLHRVTPVTSGVRRTLVMWTVGPRFR